MRIISGKYRRRNLFSPPETVQTRPIPDRVKESIFGILRGNIAGARVLDAFAGTGAVGLEAISRGAEHCIFLERDRRAADVLERNIAALGCQEQCTVVRGDALGPAALTRIAALGGVDLIFFDPPYPLIRDNSPGGGWDRCRLQFQRCVALLSDSGFAAIRTPWPFRHPDVVAAPAAAPETHGPGGGGRKGKWKKGKRRKGDDAELGNIETEWIGSDIDIEAIQRETRELEERLNQRDERSAPGAGERDADGKPSIKRHLTIADLDDERLDDENADDLPEELDDESGDDGGDWVDELDGDIDEDGDDAADEAAEPDRTPHGKAPPRGRADAHLNADDGGEESTDPAIVYHVVDLTMEGADGPETHEYGSTAVHLYMRKKH